MAGLSFVISGDNKRLRDAFRQSMQDSLSFSRTVEKHGDAMESTFKRVAAAAGITFSAVQIKNFVNEVIRARGEMQMLESSFDILLKGKGVTKFLEEIKQFSVDSPISLPGASHAAQTLLGYNVEAEKVIPIIKQLGDVSMGSEQSFQSLTLAFAQMSATGRLVGQELLQFINAGFNPLQEISAKTGKSMAELKKDMEAGAISSKMVEDAFISATEEGGRFYGMTQKQAEGIRGLQSQLQGGILKAFDDLGRSQEDLIKGGYKVSISLVENYKEIGEAIALLVGTYGAYKAAIVTVSTIEKSRVAILESELSFNSLMAVSKKNLTRGTYEYTAAVKAELVVQQEKELAALREIGYETRRNYVKLQSQLASAQQAIIDAKETGAKAKKIKALQAEASAIGQKTAAARLDMIAAAQGITAKKADIAATAANAASTNALAAAKKRLATVSKNLLKFITPNPYLLLAGAVVGAGYGIYKLANYMTEAEKAQKRLNNTTKEYEKSLVSEQMQIDILFRKLRSATNGTDEYQKAKDNIISKYGTYLSGLGEEIESLRDVEKSYKAISAAAIQAAKDRAIEKGTEEAAEAYTKVYQKNLGKIKDDFIKEFGDIKGIDLLDGLKESLRDGGELTKEVQDAISSFEKTVFSTQGTAGVNSSYQSNIIELYVKNIRDSKKVLDDEVEDIQAIFGKVSQKDEKGDSSPFVDFNTQLKEAKENASKLKTELDNLRGGIVPIELKEGEQFDFTKAIEDKTKEYEKAAEKLATLTGKDDKADKRAGKEADKRLEAQKRLNNLLIQLDLDTEAARVSAMEEGREKRLAEIDKTYNAEKAKISETRQKLIDEYNKANNLQGESKVTEDTFKDKMPSAYNKIIKAEEQAEAAKNARIKDLNHDLASELEAIRNNVYSKFRTDLDNQLIDIENFYKEQVRLKKLSIEEARELSEKEKNLARGESSLRENDVDTSIAVSSFDNNTYDLGMTEAVERQKTEILKAYALERLEILRSMGTEQANLEARQLEVTIQGYEKALSKPKKIKNIVDEKALKKVQDHFIKLGDSEKDALDKAQKFFSSFTEGGEVAVDVIGMMQSAFGGLDTDLDKALDAAMNIAKGFAEGGLVGGISAAAGQLINTTMGLLTAKREIDKSMVEGYENYIEIIDKLIDKQIQSLESLGAGNFAKQTIKTYDDLLKRMKASRRLFSEAMRAGSGVFSHSDGYKANKMLRGYQSELRKIGIYQTDLNKLTNEQLMSLTDIPEVWAKLPDDIRKYIEHMIDAKEKTEELKDEIQGIMLGFDAGGITDAIVDAFKDNSIEDAMLEVSDKVDGWIGGIVGNIIKQVALIEPVTAAVNQLMKGIGKYDKDGNLIGFKDKGSIGSDVYGQFKETIMGLAEEFGTTWTDMAKELEGIGINLGGGKDDSDPSKENSLRGAYGRASNESIELLAGQTGAARKELQDIKENTGGIYQAMIERSPEGAALSLDLIESGLSDMSNIMQNGFSEVRAIKDLTQQIKDLKTESNRMTENIESLNGKIAENTGKTARALESGTIRVNPTSSGVGGIR